MAVPIIDLFSGPGGLGEGFGQTGWKEGDPFFEIALSVEKEKSAHRTLTLRSFLRKFPYDRLPEEYFNLIKKGENPEDILLLEKYTKESEEAKSEVWKDELRDDPEFNKVLDQEIEKKLAGKKDWVLIGGPPCQAYSLAGRVRNKGIIDYKPEEDHRHFLYREYLRILGKHKPAVFVMENVKGLLSSKVNGNVIFNQILSDLRNPDGKKLKYRIFSLIKETDEFTDAGDPVFNDSDFIVKMENYGVPQKRHRVILLGIRDDLLRNTTANKQPPILIKQKGVQLNSILTLPALRSGISRGKHTAENWLKHLKEFPLENYKKDGNVNEKVLDRLTQVTNTISIPSADRGGEFVKRKAGSIKNNPLKGWIEDSRLNGIANHTARTHMHSDLYRYLFSSCFADVMDRSPKLPEFPNFLQPEHANRNTGDFTDRFRVQLADHQANTVTSHISKDGHYYIHPDPMQCRSLTVREAARIQTFPDNYFFCGNRTQQYVQVGNAVPPFLANQVAEIVKEILEWK